MDEEKASAEVAALWRETFGEQPAITADAGTMLRILVECLHDPGPFELKIKRS